MTKRISMICGHLPKAEVFADIGCDHGYCTQYALQNGLCKRAYISDISAESLKKAERLLKAYVEAGSCIPVCADGLSGIPEPCSAVLIAGMGGEEIVRILENVPLPENFVLQPMKNTEKVRAFLLERGAKIEKDFTFEDGKYYDLITGSNRGAEQYTDFELLFGRDNLKNPSEAFRKMLVEERGKIRARLKAEMRRESREKLTGRLRYIEEVTDVFEDDL